MRLCAIVLGILGVLISGAPAAMASMHVSVFGDGTFSSTTNTGGATNPTQLGVGGPFGIGGGAQIEFGLGQMLGLEIGGIYLSRKTQSSGAPTQQTATYIQVPAMFRYWVGHHFSVGAGGYYAKSIADIKVSDGTTQAMASQGLGTSDYGLMGSVGFYIPMSSSASFFVDGRYGYGLVDNLSPSVAGATTKWTDVEVLIGLRFGMMSK